MKTNLHLYVNIPYVYTGELDTIDFGDFINDGGFYPNRYNENTKPLADKYHLDRYDYDYIALWISEKIRIYLVCLGNIRIMS